MGFMDYLTPLTQAASGWQQGAQAAQAKREADTQRQIELLRQKRADQRAEMELQSRLEDQKSLRASRDEDIRIKQQKLAGQKRAKLNLQTLDPTNALLQYGDDEADFIGEVLKVNEKRGLLDKENAKQKPAYDVLVKRFPKSEYASIPYDMKNPADYKTALDAEIANDRQAKMFKHMDVSREDTQQHQIDLKGMGGGAGQSGGPSSADMQSAYDHFAERVTNMQKNNTPVTPGMVTREAAQFGQTSAAAKGETSLKNIAIGTGMDVFGQGTSQPGYDDYASAVQAARQFADETTRLFKQRGGYMMYRNQIAEAMPTAQDFMNPFTLQQKLQRMRILIERARSMEGTTPRGATPAGGGAGSSGGSALDRARAMVRDTP